MNRFESEQLIATYAPVIQRGYLHLFDAHPEVPIGVFDDTIIRQFDYLRKDIRALQPEQAVDSLQGLGYTASLIGKQAIESFIQLGTKRLIMPDDDLTEELLHTHRTPATQVTVEPVFLRWDRNNTKANAEVTPDYTITGDDFSNTIIHLLSKEANKSSDWWRHVSAALVKNDEVIALDHNRALPTPYSHYIDGDPRMAEKRGSNIEASLFIHAESDLIGQMARTGQALEGAALYVSTFPCPNCAKLIAVSGIKQCYFVEGYAMVDGLEVLKNANVEIIKIETSLPPTDSSSIVLPYPVN